MAEAVTNKALDVPFVTLDLRLKGVPDTTARILTPGA